MPRHIFERCGTEMLAQGMEGREAPQRGTDLVLELAKRAATITHRREMPVGKVAIEQIEHLQLRGGDTGVVHEHCSTQAGQYVFELGTLSQTARRLAFGKVGNRLRVEVKDIQEVAAARRIGARALGLFGEQGMHRIEADGTGAASGSAVDEIRQ